MSESDMPPDQDDLQKELASGADEPLLPVEKMLIAGSLLLGALLLGILYWISVTYFPVSVGR
jgi:hypothetical protein